MNVIAVGFRGGSVYIAVDICFLYFQTGVVCYTALQGRTCIENNIGFACQLKLILPIDENLKLIIHRMGMFARIISDESFSFPRSMSTCHRVINTHRTTETGNVTGIVRQSYLDTVQFGYIDHRIFRKRRTRIIEPQNRLSPSDLNT